MQGPRPRILYVEEDRSASEQLAAILEKLGYEITFAHTFAAALTHVMNAGFEVYILGKQLPDGTGLNLCKLIRQSDTQSVIIFNAPDATPEDMKKAFKVGANAYFTKPINNTEVEQLLL